MLAFLVSVSTCLSASLPVSQVLSVSQHVVKVHLCVDGRSDCKSATSPCVQGDTLTLRAVFVQPLEDKHAQLAFLIAASCRPPSVPAACTCATRPLTPRPLTCCQ
ncbi:hypothetical protein BaRGS_00029523 [Batillaria attramentaria]|uniref:Secreted protein n=1 Tax=Batillaria attramentaria TaxID=370345 RepID=A0ABD0JXG1_9CAEN